MHNQYPQRPQHGSQRGPHRGPPQVKKSSSTGWRIAGVIFSVLIGLVSFPCTTVAMVELIQGSANVSGNVIMGIFFAMMSVVSIALFYFSVRKKKEPPFQINEWHERQILSLAQREDGILSIASVALNTELSIDQSALALEELERRGVATTWINEDGDLVYRFASLSRGAPRAQGERPSQAPRDRARSELDEFDRQLREGAGSDQSDYAFDFEQPQSENAAPQHVHQPQQFGKKKG